MTSSSKAQTQATNDLELLDGILERAAEVLGDVHPQILKYFLDKHPEAKQVFILHGGVHPKAMQYAMIDWGMHCMFCWLEDASEAKNVLTDAAHQHKFKQIDLGLTRALMTSIFVIIGGSIPDDSNAELQLWSGIESDITQCLIQAEML